MRTSSKILLAIGSGIAAIGLVFFGIGASMGGLQGSYRLEHNIRNRVQTELEMIDGFAGTETIVEDEGYRYHYNYSYSYDDERTSSWTEYDNVNQIKIDVDYGEILIVEEPGSSIVAVDGDMSSNFQCSVDNGVLKIKDQSGKSKDLFKEGFKNSNRSLVIYVPAGFVLEELKILTGAGDIDIQDVNAKKVAIECGAGNIYIQGDIDGGLAINTGVGNVDVFLKKSFADYNYKLMTGVGEIEVYGHNSDGTFTSFIGGSYNKDNKVDKDIKISSGVGDIYIGF